MPLSSMEFLIFFSVPSVLSVVKIFFFFGDFCGRIWISFWPLFGFISVD